MRSLRRFFIISLSFAGLTANAESLPPLGKRVYLLDSQKPARPADIRPLERGSSVPGQSAMMRDPLQPGVAAAPDKSAHKPAAAPKRISRISFDKVQVQGRYLVPRVSFDRPLLDLGPEEEPVKVEYKKKILDSERELREFDW